MQRSRLAIALLGACLVMHVAAKARGQERAAVPATQTHAPAGHVPLETDLPADVLAEIPQPIRLPSERTVEFYGRALGRVFAHLRQPGDAPEFVEWVGRQVAIADRGEPLDLEQLRRDAARLARIRLRQTAAERQSGRRAFVAFEDMLRHPDFYIGRPFTTWGHVRRVTALSAGTAEPGGPAIYEFRLEPVSGPRQSSVVVLSPNLPDGFPTGGEAREAVTVTGYLIRAESESGSGENEAGFTPLLVASSLAWHRADLSREHRDSLAAVVQHRAPHLRDEIDEFYRLLRHAQLVQDESQRAAARRFLRERIEQFPRDARADLEHRLRQVAAAREAKSADEAALARREDQARTIFQHERRLYEKFRDDPRQFPIFAHVFRSADSSEPHRYTGRLVRLAGTIRKHVAYPADPENEHGVTWLHEVWLYPDDSGSNPAVVVCTSVPHGLPAGENLLERAAVTGYFYKLWAYPAKDTNRVAPMILARQVEWQPRDAASAPWWMYVAGWSIGGLAAVVIVWTAWRQSRSRRPPIRHLRTTQDQPPDFSQFS
ncbi:MAG TPA: hypothetical protein VML55_18670 [Planctomycetaceae bacterium]|nr:hypothetical protein [Planctomycetaceae bacterium]